MYIYCLRLFKRSNCKARFYSPLSSSCIHFVLCIMRRNKGQITSIYKCQLGSISAQFQYARITNSTHFISSFHIRFIILIYGQQRIFIFELLLENFIKSHITFYLQTAAKLHITHFDAILNVVFEIYALIWSKYDLKKWSSLDITMQFTNAKMDNWFGLSSSLLVRNV